MPFLIIKGDITELKVDAIVNAANSSLLGGGGVDGAIHMAAGPKLLEECRTLNGCKTGEAKYTGGYNLPAKYVIHTVGPIYYDGKHHEEELLTNCYLNSLKIAKELNVESVAFPLISSGVYGYPFEGALKVAREAIRSFIKDYDILVYLVIYDKRTFHVKTPFDIHVEKREKRVYDRSFESMCCMSESRASSMRREYEESNVRFSIKEDLTFNRDNSFSEMLFELIDKKGLDDVEFYKKANINKKVFSKARNTDYRPSKVTACAFGLALELDEDEFDKFLKKAGYALSDYLMFDVIISQCVKHKIYDVLKVNEYLFEKDQKLLGI